MHDFSCTKPEDIINPVLRDRVRYLKEKEGGLTEMCELMDEWMEKRVNERTVELAKQAIIDGDIPLSRVAKLFQLPISFVEELAKSIVVAPQNQ
jgi:hypothetical protein